MIQILHSVMHLTDEPCLTNGLKCMGGVDAAYAGGGSTHGDVRIEVGSSFIGQEEEGQH